MNSIRESSTGEEDCHRECGCSTFRVGSSWWVSYCPDHAMYGQRDTVVHPSREDEEE
tara:strand:+ start:280 stop:450 length:171 start_codon:yes stop_codon:yes gene_type:complete